MKQTLTYHLEQWIITLASHWIVLDIITMQKKRNWEAIEVHIRHMGRNSKRTVAWWLKKNNPIKNIQASKALQALDQTIIHCLHTSKSVSEQANYISDIKQSIWFTKSLIGNTKYTERQKITLVYPINPKTRSSWN